MTKCKLFYVLLTTSFANFFIINNTNAIDNNQSSHNELRNQSDSSVSETNSIIEEIKKFNVKKSTNSPNIKQPNENLIFHKKLHPLKFTHDEKKFLNNLFNNKSSKNKNRIERQSNKNINKKKRDCKKICYPFCYVKNFNNKEDMDSDEIIQYVQPQNPFYQFPNYGYPFYLNNIYNYPYGIDDSEEEEKEEEDDDEDDDDDGDDDYNDDKNIYCSEENTEDDQENKKKNGQTGKPTTYESENSTGKGTGITNEAQEQSTETKETYLLKLFHQLSVVEQNILQQTISKVLEDYNFTLKSIYKITNLNEIFENSYVQKMLINAIRTVLKKKYEEYSISRITDEIIQSALMNFVINNDLSKNNIKKSLIPIAEINFKIGQWIHNNENYDSQKIQDNEETQNLLNFETQIIPLIQNHELENKISITVNSKVNPLYKQNSVETQNAKTIHSESDLINNLLPKYYSSESKNMEYKKNNGILGINNQNFIGNSQFTESSLLPSNKNSLQSYERNIQMNDQFSQVSREKLNSQSKSNFNSVSNRNNDGNSQVSTSLKHQQISEHNKDLNQSQKNDLHDKIQYNELRRNKKHSDPKKNFNETSEKNINKNPHIIGLLINDQKTFAKDKNFSLAYNDNIDKNSQFHTSIRINRNDNFQKTTGIERIGQIDSHTIDKKNNHNFFMESNVNDTKIMENNLQSSKELNNSMKVESRKHLKTNNLNYHRNSYILGKLIPKNKKNSEFLYKGNLLRLPLKLTKLKDGSFLVTLLNKIRNFSQKIHCSHHPRNHSGINKRDNEGRILEKDESCTNNFTNQEMDTIKTKEYLRRENFTNNTTEDKKDEHEQYKQYLETLLEVNNIPKKERSVIITDALEKKMLNSRESNFDINKKNTSKKDDFKNNLIIEKITLKSNKPTKNTINYEKSNTSNINTAFDIIKIIFNWLQDFILTTLNAKKS